ncbi:putative ribonuclease H-like domain-containing protein [Tanacetum coccineum]
MNELCIKKGIKREFSVARTPQQNGVVERKNMTLIEAARTMLVDSLLPIPFWAEAVNTACYVLNRVLVTKPQNKTPYELLIGNSPSISFMRHFGCPLTILNTLDSLSKFDGKSDEGYLLGYSTTRTGPNWMFDLDFLTNSMNYIPVSVENQVNVDAGTQDSYVAGSSGKHKGLTQEYILLPLQPHRTRILVKDVALAAHEKPSESSPEDNDVQDSEDDADKEEQHQMKESEQDLQDELEKMVTQELAAKAMDDVSRQAFEEEKRRIASQKKAAQATSHLLVLLVLPHGNTGESSFVYLGGIIPIDASTLPNVDLPIDPNMPNLEDASDTLPNDGIFNRAYDDDKDVGAVADFNNMDNTIAVSPIPTLRIHKDHLKGQILGDPTSAVQTKGKIQKASSAQQALVSYFYKQNRTNHKDHQNCLFVCFLSQEEPKTISQALQDESWVEAMQEELLPNKRDERSIVVKNKARLVVQGFRQEEDVKSAFLYGTIEEEVYVHQPSGFVDPARPNKVYKVIKALYDLHQAPRAWYETLSSYLMENVFRRGTIDKTLFIKKKKSDIMLVQVYVDDIIFGSTKKSMCTEFEDSMHKRFQMSSMGELTFFLGLQVKQQPDEIFISQDKYVADIFKKFDFLSIRTATTPIESNKPLVKDEDGVDVDVHVYRSMIGSLMYLTASRPDIHVCFKMTTLKYSDKHNMVAFLKKPNESVGFTEIVDFLKDATGISNLPDAEIYDGLATLGGYVGDYVPLLPAMLAGAAEDQGEGSAIPAEPQHINHNLTDPRVGLVSHNTEGATTTTSGLDAGLDSGNIHESPLRSYEAPLHEGHTSGSAEDSLQLKELMVLVPKLVTRIANLEKELHQTKTTYGKAVLTLVERVKSLEVALKRKTKKVVVSDLEDEETENQGRKIQDIDDDPLVSLVRESMKEKDTDFVTPTKISASGEVQEQDISPTTLEAAKTLSHVISQKAKSTDKGIRYKRKTRSKSIEKDISTDLDAEEDWDIIRAKLKANAELTKSLQGESMTSDDFAKRMVDMINQRKKYFAEQKAKARRNKPMTQAEQRTYMATYLKNQGTWKPTQLKKLTFDELKTEFEKLVKSIENFVPIETDERVKRQVIANEEEIEKYCKEEEVVYQIIRKDGSDKIYMSFRAILKDFLRDDLTELYRLVIKKYGANRHEKMYDRVLWGDLKTMFDPLLSDDATWSFHFNRRMINWRIILLLRMVGYPGSCNGVEKDCLSVCLATTQQMWSSQSSFKQTIKNWLDAKETELVEVELQGLNNRTLEGDQTCQENGDDEDVGDQETDQTPDLTNYQLVQDRVPRTRTKPSRFQDESNMAAYVFVAAEEEDTHEPLTYQEAVACEDNSK